uniref:Uncharacterized protein n=1 Tax=Lotharella globosa TaxID=91324 RepID=A0A7S4DGH0_9EUKA
MAAIHVGSTWKLLLTVIVGLALAGEIPVEHFPEEEPPLPAGDANDLPVDGVVVEIEGPIGGLELDGGILGAMVDAMLAPIMLQPPAAHGGRGILGSLDPILEGPFAMTMPGPRHNSLFHRHGLFSPHSSLMRHPHVGHCHEDSHELCARQMEAPGLVGMINTMRCLAENAHSVSDACRETVVVTTLPCIDDMEAHCNNSTDSLHTCFAESHHKVRCECMFFSCSFSVGARAPVFALHRCISYCARFFRL